MIIFNPLPIFFSLFVQRFSFPLILIILNFLCIFFPLFFTGFNLAFILLLLILFCKSYFLELLKFLTEKVQVCNFALTLLQVTKNVFECHLAIRTFDSTFCNEFKFKCFAFIFILKEHFLIFISGISFVFFCLITLLI